MTALALDTTDEAKRRAFVGDVLLHAERTGDKNLRVVCMAYLDPTSDAAREWAVSKLWRYFDAGRVKL